MFRVVSGSHTLPLHEYLTNQYITAALHQSLTTPTMTDSPHWFPGAFASTELPSGLRLLNHQRHFDSSAA